MNNVLSYLEIWNSQIYLTNIIIKVINVRLTGKFNIKYKNKLFRYKLGFILNTNIWLASVSVIHDYYDIVLM